MGNVAMVSCCLSRVVRVVHPNGKVYIYTEPISIAELLLAYPHHYVRDSSDGSNPQGKMLPVEMELEVGHTYVLVPLPRLFSNMSTTGKHPQTSSRVQTAGLRLQAGSRCLLALLDSEDAEKRNVRRGTKGRVTLRSLLALETGCAGFIRRNFQSHDASRSATTLQMHRVLETAENQWKSSCQGNRTWRPELESIKEEARKSTSSSPLHELSLVEHHQRLMCTHSVNSSLKPMSDSVQR